MEIYQTIKQRLSWAAPTTSPKTLIAKESELQRLISQYSNAATDLSMKLIKTLDEFSESRH